MITRKLEQTGNRAISKTAHAAGPSAARGSRARSARSARRNDDATMVADLEAMVAAQAEELNRAKAHLAEEVDRRHRLERRFLEICERERRRFGQDLHDDTCQTLGGLAWITANAAQESMKRDPESARLFSALAKELNDALEQTYRLAQCLHPAVLKKRGLAGALGCLAERTSERIPCVLELHATLSIPDAVELALFRIAQEAVANAMKHSRATRIVIALRVVGENLILSVEDDGRGLEPSPGASRGMGRDIMEYRARAIGAELNILSRNGRGTLVHCIVPLAVERG